MSRSFIAFAYGSNMLTSRIQERCPSAHALGIAELHGYELKWHKLSKDGSGKCDIVRSHGTNDIVYGVLYKILANERIALDQAEGLGAGYETKNVEVSFNGALLEASIYYATRIDPCLRPYTWYKEFVVAGAREHGLPAKYLERLMAVDAVEDPDRNRNNSNLATLNRSSKRE